MPGGKVGNDETLEVAVVREIYEEIGARVTVKELLGDHFEEREKAIIHLHWFHCIPHSMVLVPGDDVDEARFVPRYEVPKFCAPDVVAQWSEEVQKFFSIQQS